MALHPTGEERPRNLQNHGSRPSQLYTGQLEPIQSNLEVSFKVGLSFGNGIEATNTVRHC